MVQSKDRFDNKSNAFGSQFQSDIGSEFNIINPYHYDDLEHVNLIQKNDTNGFIKRVYFTLTLQILFATACVGLLTRFKQAQVIQLDKFGIAVAAFLGFAVCISLVIFNRTRIRQFPCNYFVFVIQTLCLGYILSMTVHLHEP